MSFQALHSGVDVVCTECLNLFSMLCEGGEYASVNVSTTVGLSVRSKEMLWVDNDG